MKNKTIVLLLVCVLISFTISTSVEPVVASNNIDDNSIELVIDGLTVNVEVLSEDTNSKVMEINTHLNGEIEKEVAIIDYKKQSFTISDEDGNKETYNANDYVVDLTAEDIEYVNENMPEETVEGEVVNLNDFTTRINGINNKFNDQITPLANENTRKTFYTDIAAATGLSNGTWSNIASHKVSGKTIDVIQGVEWVDTKALKKLKFSAGLAVSVMITTIAALSAGITTGAVLAALGGIGVDVSLAYLGDDLTIFTKARKQTVGKGFYVQHEGFPTMTKKYYLYVYVLGEEKIRKNLNKRDTVQED